MMDYLLALVALLIVCNLCGYSYYQGKRDGMREAWEIVKKQVAVFQAGNCKDKEDEVEDASDLRW